MSTDVPAEEEDYFLHATLCLEIVARYWGDEPPVSQELRAFFLMDTPREELLRLETIDQVSAIIGPFQYPEQP